MNTKCRKRKLNTRSNILNRIIWYQVNVQIIIPPYCRTLFARMTSDLVISKYFVNINHDTATQIFLIESQMSNSNHAICQLCWIDYQIFCWIHIIDWRHHNVQLLYHLVLSKYQLSKYYDKDSFLSKLEQYIWKEFVFCTMLLFSLYYVLSM